MKRHLRTIKALAVGIAGALLLTGCSGGGSSYSDYASAYNRVSAKGGIDADLSATLSMDGETTSYSGNFKVDTANNLLYYEMGSGGEKTIQFSDGEYLYTSQNGKMTKYALNSKPSEPTKPESTAGNDGTSSEPPAFNTSEFLQDFSSFLEAGSVKEMGLLDPIAEAAVSKITKEGDVYTLEIADSMVETFLNSMARNNSGDGDSVQVSNLEDFTYQATVKDGVVTKVYYSGKMTITVPDSLMASGTGGEYPLDFQISLQFNNPGNAVTITLPSTDGYEEVDSLR